MYSIRFYNSGYPIINKRTYFFKKIAFRRIEKIKN
jgi:hypothetical protein